METRKKKRINMPEFRSPFIGPAKDRKLTDTELIRAIRFMVAAEYEATQLYMQLAKSTENKLAIKILKDKADQERMNVGAFLGLLYEVAPDEDMLYAEGVKEVEVEIKKMKQSLPKKTISTKLFLR